METPVIAALIGFVSALSVALINHALGRKKLPQEAIDSALDYLRKNYLPGSKIKIRNSRWRRLRSRVSIMVDVCGPRRGVYIVLIDRTGRILHIYQLHGWKPHC
jgi:hypothetical protein